jgi:D-inositol-3-phosphate glycosyltransferase
MNLYIREVSRHLSDLGVEVDVFTRQQGEHVDAVVPLAERARVIHVPAGPQRYLPKEKVVSHLPEFICNMRDFIQHDNPRYDLIHSHYWLSGRVAGYFKSAWQVPMLAMFHTLSELKNQVAPDGEDRETDLRFGIERMTVATADRVIAATAVDGNHLETYYDADRQRITILPCGVDLDLFKPGDREAARRSLAVGEERIILFVGRIQQLKGLDVLLRAASHLTGRHAAGSGPPVRVLIVGGTPSEERNDPERRELRRLQRLAAELDIESCVTWVGAVDQPELPRYYHAADVTVSPSTYESFGLVPLESMACGTPVVAAAVGGLLATVQDSRTGYLVPSREPAEYAERIAEFLEPSPIRSQFSSWAIARAGTFSWERVASQLLEQYQSLASARLRGEPPVTVWQQ